MTAEKRNNQKFNKGGSKGGSKGHMWCLETFSIDPFAHIEKEEQDKEEVARIVAQTSS
jgi:hypothetical protein